jgi:hypothetical protein
LMKNVNELGFVNRKEPVYVFFLKISFE